MPVMDASQVNSQAGLRILAYPEELSLVHEVEQCQWKVVSSPQTLREEQGIEVPKNNSRGVPNWAFSNGTGPSA
eukprot:scaffold184818_cov18-Tisochrysis_lutea.AAC.1